MLSSSINLQWPPFIQRAASDILTDYGPFVFGNRPVRTRTPGGVGAGGEKPPATRLCGAWFNRFKYSDLLIHVVDKHVEIAFVIDCDRVVIFLTRNTFNPLNDFRF